jgi:excisionase family DNA binding protein
MTGPFRDWLQGLADAEAMIPARVVLERLPADVSPAPPPAPAAEPDRLLTVAEAAERLAVDARWIYRRKDKLPFTRKIGPGTLRFSERGLERWKESRR